MSHAYVYAVDPAPTIPLGLSYVLLPRDPHCYARSDVQSQFPGYQMTTSGEVKNKKKCARSINALKVTVMTHLH